MPPPTPVSQVGPFITTTSCGTNKRLSASSKARNQNCCLSAEAAGNRDRFLPYFTKIFNLRIDNDTMRRRLQERTDDDWPLGQEGVELMLRLNRSAERPAGAIDVDATRPLDRVVDDLLRLAMEE